MLTKKIIITSTGNLTLAETQLPDLRDDEVQIKVAAAGVNFADVKIRRGYYHQSPERAMEMGSEVAGVVERTGRDAHQFSIGEKVFAVSHRGGGYAERMIVPEHSVFRLPVFMQVQEAASFASTAQTAYHILKTVLQVQSGDRVLIHSAAGGVGTMAVQMAKVLGAKVFAAASSPEKLARVKSLGADTLLQYGKDDFGKVIQREGGMNYILDGNGGLDFPKNFQWLNLRGKVVLFGNTAGATASVDPYSLVHYSKSLIGFSMFSVTSQPEIYHAAYREIFKWMEAGKVKVEIGHRLPLAEAAEAHRLLESRENYGKIVLTAE
ncbi:MAG: zinc-binding dehydrogenase [Rhizobacter sp.]|nr:zinc-binding dehydrogenase [Chlorobiales bacterium]